MDKSRLEKFKELYDKNPSNPLSSFSLANEYFKLKMYGEAVEQINNYLELKEDEGAVYRMLAESYIELGKKEDAVNAYRDGIKQALKFGHEGMAEEFEESIEFIE